MLIRHTSWFFLLVTLYVFFEVFFLTSLINTLSTSLRPEQIMSLEDMGRYITGIGTAIAFCSLLTASAVKRGGYPNIKTLLILIIPFFIGYFGIKYLFDEFVDRATPEEIICSMIGIAAKEALLEGRDIPIQDWNNESSFLPVEEFQIGLLLLPQAVCVNKEIRDIVIESDSVKGHIAKRIINSEGVSKRLKDLFLNVDALVNNMDELHPNFVKVASKKNRRRYKSRFYKAINNNHFNRFVFDSAFARVRPNEASRLTRLDLLTLLVSETLRHKGYPISSDELPRTMDTKVITEAAAKWVAMYEFNKFKSGDYSLVKSLGDEGKMGYRLMFIPLFVISVSSILVLLNIASLIRLEFLSWKHWGESVVTVKSGRLLGIASSPLLVILIIGIWGYFLPRGATEESLYGSEKSFGMHFMNTGVRIQTYLYPNTIQGLSMLGLSPYFKEAEKPNIEREELPIFNEISNHSTGVASNEDLSEALDKNYLLTPIAKSVAWKAMVLINHDNLSDDKKTEIRNAFSLYERMDLNDPKNKQKYDYAMRWLNSYL